ncbi:monofunctional biosynthetic peptidoglycan transglycosylase [Labrenzia sp. THAF82]|uniref:transglycosylase domain-containing protein n=1 Tax=Labrenzia sp. THAF82 TaxID=2587861 RepID=UPI00126819DE|nr:transglycosylase domain-containing protein [Labrenzia sp. THAF82]QFT33018.1 monofunctional biosynthetic peptidoglycan transglycosylase [Labrenzia sp. THAF82]
MKKFAKVGAGSIALLLVGCIGYGAFGYFDAISDADDLRTRADTLIASDFGGASLGAKRYQQLLAVQDPRFEQHGGVDMTTPGAGITTISQSLSKRVGFEKFTPGIGKIRQTGYALGLESELSKEQIMALWLDTLEMGRGPEGWVTGFHRMSEAVFGAPPRAIKDEQYLSLLAVMIAPARYRIGTKDDALADRTGRIGRLVSGKCAPIDNSDVWLEGCM